MTSTAETVLALDQQAEEMIAQGRYDEAAVMLTYSLQMHPENANAYMQLGNICVRRQRFDEAINQYQQALRINADLFPAHYILAIALHDKGRYEDAVTHYREALRLNPTYADAHFSLGATLLALKRFEDAVASCREATRLNPGQADAHVNLGSALQQLGRLEEAAAAYEDALRLKPGLAEAWQNLGMVRKHQGKIEEALEHIEHSLRIRPGYPMARWNRAVLWLLQGDFVRGWPEFESRWLLGNFGQRHFTVPHWDGSPLNGRTILVYGEQGLGDTIQFIRYLPLVKARGGRIVIQCQSALLPLLKNFTGIDRLESLGEFPHSLDVHAPLLSLPGILGTRVDTIPSNIPYLTANPHLVAHWRGKLARLSDLKIGIAWQGNPSYLEDARRSFQLTNFALLAKLNGVNLISLQKGPGAEQIADLPTPFPLVDFGEELDQSSGAFMDTAAIIKNLDLVITSDTVIAHLAGALGVPVWVALPSVPDWRWLLEREDSPWYPTMQLFRQRRAGDWAEVFERIAKEVALRLSDRTSLK